MPFTKRDLYVLSSDMKHTLSGVIYVPLGEAKGFFHIVHGMTEHIGRYDRIMSALADEGYICFGYDHLGHGKTAKDPSELGYIAEKDGWDLLCRDVKAFSDGVFSEFKEYGDLPYFLMGHSMGSFVVRLAAEKYVHPDKLIIMGTGGSNPAAGVGIMLINIIKLFKGDRHISHFIDSMAFGSYNKRFKNDYDADSSSWLTTDTETRNKYRGDSFCTFKFTVSAMGDLMHLLKYSNRRGWYRNISKTMPILMVSGEDDPVGNYGKGVIEVEKRLKKHGANVKCVLYKGARHEILNDFCYNEVKREIIDFINH